MTTSTTSTSTSTNDATDAADLVELYLDELMPRPWSPLRRMFLAFFLVSVSIAFVMAWIIGVIVPQPWFGTGGSTGSHFRLDADRELIVTDTALHNGGRRDVRVTSVVVDSPGAVLVEAAVMLRSSTGDGGDCIGHDDGDIVCTIIEEQTRPTREVNGYPAKDALTALPVVLPRGQDADLVLWFEIEDCSDIVAPWGTIDVTMDFGDGAFPPWSRDVEHWDTLVEDSPASDGPALFGLNLATTEPGSPEGAWRQTCAALEGP